MKAYAGHSHSLSGAETVVNEKCIKNAPQGNLSDISDDLPIKVVISDCNVRDALEGITETSRSEISNDSKIGAVSGRTSSFSVKDTEAKFASPFGRLSSPPTSICGDFSGMQSGLGKFPSEGLGTKVKSLWMQNVENSHDGIKERKLEFDNIVGAVVNLQSTDVDKPDERRPSEFDFDVTRDRGRFSVESPSGGLTLRLDSGGKQDPLLCFTSFHARETTSQLTVWENPSPLMEGTPPHGTLIVRNSEGSVQKSTFHCPMKLVIEIRMNFEEVDSRLLPGMAAPTTLPVSSEPTVPQHHNEPLTFSRMTTTNDMVDELPDSAEDFVDSHYSTRQSSNTTSERRKRSTAHNVHGTRKRHRQEDNGDQGATSLLRYQVEDPLLEKTLFMQRDRRGRKSLKGGSARDAFSVAELERLKNVSWPTETRNKDGLPAVWCPRCYLETSEFLHLQVSTRLTIKGEPRIDLRHAKCAKGFAVDLFPRRIIDSYLQRARPRIGTTPT